jgi:hypothetical protein
LSERQQLAKLERGLERCLCIQDRLLASVLALAPFRLAPTFDPTAQRFGVRCAVHAI